MFELTNGFKKAIYWSKKQMMAHADKYSPAFSANGTTVETKYGSKQKVSFEEFEAGNYPEKDAWMYSSFWYKNFDGMAFKTMLRQLISKWGIMSIELQSAFENDMTFTDEAGNINYVEPVDDVIDAEIIEQPEEVQEEKTEDSVNEKQTSSSAADALFGK